MQLPYRQHKIEDRFIPNRTNLDICHSLEEKSTTISTSLTYSSLINFHSSPKKILKFNTKQQQNKSLFEFITGSINRNKRYKRISKKKHPIKILDAPGVIDNYYYNLLDVSHKGMISVALGNQIFFYDNGYIDKLNMFSLTTITSSKFHPQSDIFVLGNETGRVQMYDIEKNMIFREIKAHYERIGCLQFLTPKILLTGSKDKTISLHDIRVKRSCLRTFEKHKGQVCGLAANGCYFGSSGNDGRVLIWDISKGIVINQIKQFKGAVKSIKWCPWRYNILGVAGGHDQKKTIVWNGSKSQIQNIYKEKNQITSLIWNVEQHKLITSHGGKYGYLSIKSAFNSQAEPQLLFGHKGRILSVIHNPFEPNELCSLGADDTLRFWNVAVQETDKQNDDKNSQQDNLIPFQDQR